MYTRKALLYLSMATFIVSLSVALRNSYLLAFIIPFAILIFASSIKVPFEDIAIEVMRNVSNTMVFVGEEVEVILELENKGEEILLEVIDDIQAELLLKEGSNRAFMALRKGERARLAYKVACERRGHYKVGPVRFTAYDPLKLRLVEREVPSEASINVFPRYDEVGIVEVRPRRTRHWPGSVRSRRSGEGVEFYGIRGYVPGDELRRVNWKATARLSSLITNLFESEGAADVVIIVDASWSEEELNEVLELEVEAAASLCSSLLRAGNRVGLIACGLHRGWIKPGFGRGQMLKILHFLADLRPGMTIPMHHVMRFLTPFILKPGAQVILISPLLDGEVVDVVEELKAAGYNVIILSPSPFEVKKSSKELAESFAARIADYKRMNVLLRLKGYCLTLDWSLNVPLKEAVKEVRIWQRLMRA